MEKTVNLQTGEPYKTQRKRELVMYGFSKSELAALNEAAQERELNDEEVTAFEFLLDQESEQDRIDEAERNKYGYLHYR